MEVVNLILIGYFLPLIVNLFFIYLGKGIKTVGDFLRSLKEGSVYVFFPIINLIATIAYAIMCLSEYLGDNLWWKKFKQMKIK
jgi:hypothetical protein